jgi:hypothetical protein
MSKRRRPNQRHNAQSGFWEQPEQPDDTTTSLRPTPDPAAIPRSLGDPPLAANPALSQHHLGLVYEEAVRAATALAAANGLLAGNSESS